MIDLGEMIFNISLVRVVIFVAVSYRSEELLNVTSKCRNANLFYFPLSLLFTLNNSQKESEENHSLYL